MMRGLGKKLLKITRNYLKLPDLTFFKLHIQFKISPHPQPPSGGVISKLLKEGIMVLFEEDQV